MSMFVSRKLFAAATAAFCAAVMIGAPAEAAAPPVPVPSTPCGGQTIDRQVPLAWSAVTGATQYEWQISSLTGDPSDWSATVNNGQHTTNNTRAVMTTSLPSGDYHWRVRSWSATSDASAWSAGCNFTVDWADAPSAADMSPQNDAAVTFPDPVKLSWNPVDGATRYSVTLSSSSDLSTPVNGFPVQTNATVVTPSAQLKPGTYWWQVTPIDAQGNAGTLSPIEDFTWNWPSDGMTLSPVADLDPSPEVFDPQFSWTPVPGAVGYQLQINHDRFFSSSDVCCDNATITATSYSPTTLLTPGVYFWRVRALDASGNLGDWVTSSSSFSIHYADNVNTTWGGGIPHLTMVDGQGNDVWTPGFTTDTPIVTWDATPGAATYKVEFAGYGSGICDFSHANSSTTAATAWTPQANDQLTAGASYCIRVTPLRHDEDPGPVATSATTQLGGVGNAAFTFSGYPAGNPCTQPCNPNLNIGAGDYELPAAGSDNTSLPLFTWKPIAGIQRYEVIVATDNTFQHIIDTAYTHVPAYAVRGNSMNYPDTSTSYAWAVLPAPGFDGQNAATDPTANSSYPQTFQLHSLPPVLVAPADSATVSGPPSFQWFAVPGAYRYELTIATSSSFSQASLVNGSPFQTQTTSFTGANLPPATKLWWKVRAYDHSGNPLSFSATRQLTDTVQTPTFGSVSNPVNGQAIPAFSWDPTPGAISYDVQVLSPGGSTSTNTVQNTTFAPTGLNGLGNFTWRVRAEYPTAGPNVPGTYSAWQPFARSMAAPASPVTQGLSAHQVVVSWNQKDGANHYDIEFATDSTFGNTTFDSFSTQNTSAAPGLTAGQYANGGVIYWHVRADDNDGNQGAWSAPQTLTLPMKMFMSFTGSVHRNATTTIKVYTKTAYNKAISGVSVKDSGCGVKSATLKTGSSGAASFKIKPTCKGALTFTATKAGAITTTFKITGIS